MATLLVLEDYADSGGLIRAGTLLDDTQWDIPAKQRSGLAVVEYTLAMVPWLDAFLAQRGSRNAVLTSDGDLTALLLAAGLLGGGGGGGGAPTNAAYVVLAPNAGLTNERVLTGEASVVSVAGAPGTATVGILAGGISNAKLTASPANTVKANATAAPSSPGDLPVPPGSLVGRAAGNIAALTGPEATALLSAFSAGLQGVAPASGGGTVNFLRADSTWSAPPVGAPPGASYVVLSADPTLTSERILTGESTVLSVTDAGPGLAVTVGLATAGVVNAKLATAAANTVKANATAGVASPTDLSVGANTVVGRLAGNVASLTGTQFTTLVDVFTPALKGLAPPSGGGVVNFLRADGTWAPPGITVTELEFTVGAADKPVWTKTFTVFDAAVTGLSTVVVTQSGRTGTGRVGNDLEWDQLLLGAVTGPGFFTVTAQAVPGPISGIRVINYQVF